MKTIKLKSLSLCFLLLFLSACNQSNSQNKKRKPSNNTSEKAAFKGVFTGNYIASYENASISAEMIENNTVVKGFFYMDGVQNEIIAISNKNNLTGKIKDKSKSIYYDFTALLKGNVLTFSITFPELDNKIIELVLTKQESTTTSNLYTTKNTPISSSKPSKTINSKTKDSRLIGTWRYTEVLNSGGYGGDYASLATDYYIQFKPNGECLSWSGSSAGGTSNATYYSSGTSTVTTEGWYTEGKNIVFYDLNTNEEISIPFLADENRFLLRGSSTKIYERVN